MLVDTDAEGKAGDTLAVLDQDSPWMQILQARAGLAQAEAHLAGLASLARQVADIVRSTRGTVDVSDGGVVGHPSWW